MRPAFALAALFAGLVPPGAAHADVWGHSCEQRLDLPGTGRVTVSRLHTLNRDAAPQPQVTWEAKRPNFDFWAFKGIAVRFIPPSATAPARAWELDVEYTVKGTPEEAVWLAARMGETLAQAPVYLPPPYRFERFTPGRFGGYGGRVTLKGRDFAAAYARGAPLEVFLLGAGGRVVASHLEPLADRGLVDRTIAAAWPDILRRGERPAELCTPLEIHE